MLETILRSCLHEFETVTDNTVRLFDEGESTAKGHLPYGFAKLQHCSRCGDVRRVDLANPRHRPTGEPRLAEKKGEHLTGRNALPI